MFPDSSVVREIKERLGWIEPPSSAIKIKAPAGRTWDLDSEEGIFEAIRAIVEQDKKRYSGAVISEAVGAMNTTDHFTTPRYDFGNVIITLRGLFGRCNKRNRGAEYARRQEHRTSFRQSVHTGNTSHLSA